MVRIAAESEPASGSVIAIAAHLPSKRCFCSSSATAAIAELPSPWRGIDSSRPTSPQHISVMAITEAMLEPFLLPLGLGRFSAFSADLAAAGGAGAAGRVGVVHAVDQRGEHVELLRVLVLGEVVLARDRPQDLLRDLVGLLLEGLELLRDFE